MKFKALILMALFFIGCNSIKYTIGPDFEKSVSASVGVTNAPGGRGLEFNLMQNGKIGHRLDTSHEFSVNFRTVEKNREVRDRMGWGVRFGRDHGTIYGFKVDNQRDVGVDQWFLHPYLSIAPNSLSLFDDTMQIYLNMGPKFIYTKQGKFEEGRKKQKALDTFDNGLGYRLAFTPGIEYKITDKLSTGLEFEASVGTGPDDYGLVLRWDILRIRW